MDQQVIDRREDARVLLDPTRLQATLRPGCSVRVVDLSDRGALVEAARPLRPGARVHVQLVARTRTFSVTARILRCAVWHLHPIDGVTYRGALQFEDRCESIREFSTQCGADVPGWATAHESGEGQPIPEAERTIAMKTRGTVK